MMAAQCDKLAAGLAGSGAQGGHCAMSERCSSEASAQDARGGHGGHNVMPERCPGEASAQDAQDAQDEHAMRMALDEAYAALDEGEVPVGAVVMRAGNVIARAHNRRERDHDPTAHAEVLALRAAAAALEDWRLNDCTLYVTLEPCPMCAGAIVSARVGRVVYGAYDGQRGCCGSVYRLPEDPAFNAFTCCTGGVLERECALVMDEFLRRHR